MILAHGWSSFFHSNAVKPKAGEFMEDGTRTAFLRVEVEHLTFVYRLRGRRLDDAPPLIVLGPYDGLPNRGVMWRAEGMAI
jgi:hypothetical protein